MGKMSLLVLRQNFGFCLVFVGVTTSMFLNYFIPIIYWTPLVMFLSCLLLCDKRTFNRKYYWNKSFKRILLFQLFMLMYFLLTYEMTPLGIKYFSFHVYILSLIFILIKTPSLRERNYIPLLFVYSSILSLIAAICYFTGLISLDRMLNKEDAILESFTCNIAAYVSFITSMILLNRKRILLSLLIIGIMIADLYVIMQSNKRSYFVSVLVAGFIYLYKKKCLKKGLFAIAMVYMLLAVSIPEVREMTINMIERTITGFSTVYLDDSTSRVDLNDSASIRQDAKEAAIQKVADFSVFNYLFGAGYRSFFFDNPLAESYVDMGIIGLAYYFFLMVVMPIVFYRKLRVYHERELFCFFLALMNICIIITNNDPYIYIAYTPLCVMSLYSYTSDYIRFKA